MSKKYFYYHKWENETGRCHTTVVTDQPPKEFLDSLLGNWVEIRQFSSEEELRKFGNTVGLTRSERRIGVWVNS